MTGRIFNWPTSTNPVVQVLSVLAMGVVLIGAVLIGAVILAVALGLAIVAAIVFYLRIWWLRRRFARAVQGHRGAGGSRDPSGQGSGTRRQSGGGSEDARTIEVEYTVVDERDPRDPRDPRDRQSPRD